MAIAGMDMLSPLIDTNPVAVSLNTTTRSDVSIVFVLDECKLSDVVKILD
jgi:hypothetical protein